MTKVISTCYNTWRSGVTLLQCGTAQLSAESSLESPQEITETFFRESYKHHLETGRDRIYSETGVIRPGRFAARFRRQAGVLGFRFYSAGHPRFLTIGGAYGPNLPQAAEIQTARRVAQTCSKLIAAGGIDSARALKRALKDSSCSSALAPTDRGITTQQLLQFYIDDLHRRHCVSSQQVARSIDRCTRVIEKSVLESPLSSLDIHALDDALRASSASHSAYKKIRSYLSTSVNLALSGAYDHVCDQQGVIVDLQGNPLSELPQESLDTAQRTLSLDEFRHVLAALLERGTPPAEVALCALQTYALPVRYMCNVLAERDIDWQKGSLTINRKTPIDGGRYEFCLPRNARELIEDQLNGLPSHVRNGYLFSQTADRQAPISTRQVARVIAKIFNHLRAQGQLEGPVSYQDISRSVPSLLEAAGLNSHNAKAIMETRQAMAAYSKTVQAASAWGDFLRDAAPSHCDRGV